MRAVQADPGLDLIRPPNPAQHQLGYRLGERVRTGDLVGSLTAYPAQADADLVGAEEL